MQVEITHLFLKLLIPIIQKYLLQMQVALPRLAEVTPRSRHNALRDRFLFFVNNSPQPQRAHMEATKELL